MSETRPDAAEQPDKISDGSTPRGTIWRIDRFATHDGPGIRTTLYFKGCPLKCRWCSNPEGQKPEPVLLFREAQCNGCGLCIAACPNHALALRQPNSLNIDRAKCRRVGDCVAKCPTKALQVWGESYSIPDVLDLLEKDRSIHRKSGGGLTCTGGDPLQQGDFIVKLLKQCNLLNIHTAVETSACIDERAFAEVLKSVDHLFIDLKHMNPERHLALTGVRNDIILRNAHSASSALKSRGKFLVFRQVVVPGVNDGDNITELADFLASLPFLSGVELLAYHNYGAYKYELLGDTYSLITLEPPTAEEMASWKDVLKRRGLPVIG